MKKEIMEPIQNWLPIEEIFENGIIKLKENNYIKIIKIIPVNYNLKSDLEKEAILNSYQTFLKTCQFDMQIIIQSNKEYIFSQFYKNHILLETSSNHWYYYIFYTFISLK